MSSNSSKQNMNNPIGEGNSSLHHTTQRILKFKTKKFDDSTNFNNLLETSLNNKDDKTHRMHVSRAYNELYDHYELFTDEESLIHRMERKSQIRNTFFRGITTLTIGFSIMLVYWVASVFSIAMPLMKLPL
jgi:hypothetical protein